MLVEQLVLNISVLKPIRVYKELDEYLKMNKKYKNSIIMIFIDITIIGVGYLVTINVSKIPSDISEIKSIVSEYNLEYKSDRGFGNDRFDIYSFSLKDNSQYIGFKLYDEEIEDIYTYNFKSLIDTEADTDNSIEKISSDIERLKKENDINYIYVKSDETQKIYLYSKKNKQRFLFNSNNLTSLN